MFTGLGEGFQMRWCTISAEETAKCDAFKAVIERLATQANLTVTFSCVQESKATDCMGKIQSGQADLITLDGGEILIAGKQTLYLKIRADNIKTVFGSIPGARSTLRVLE